MSNLIADHHHACSILGITDGADQKSIKTAYRALLKKYHPDVTGDNSSLAIERYELINQAFEFLINEAGNGIGLTAQESMKKADYSYDSQYRASGPKIVGQNVSRQSSGSDYAAFEKKYQKIKKEKKQEFIKKQEELAKKRKKDQEDYDRVMKAVEAIRTARAIEALIRASDDMNKQ